jgi:hypothetical protein
VHGETTARHFIHHFALEVDDFMGFYERASLAGIKEAGFLSTIYELPDGAVQMYVRDPADNLVELICRDRDKVDSSQIPEFKVLANTIPPEAGSAEARVFNYPHP